MTIDLGQHCGFYQESIEECACGEVTQDVCMNPGIQTCDSCIFNGRVYRDGVTPWCKPEEKEAKNR